MLKIKKRSDYKEHKCLLGLGTGKDADFNKGKSVEVEKKDFDRLIKFDFVIEVKGVSK